MDWSSWKVQIIEEENEAEMPDRKRAKMIK